MKKQIFVSLAFCLLLIHGATGQTTNGVCGTSPENQLLSADRLKENLLKAENGQAVTDRSAVQYVPIHFHIVGDASGGGKHNESSILDQLCDMNEAYAPMEIRFYLRAHPTYGLFDYSINNDDVNTMQTNTFLMANRRHNNALNVYVVSQASGTDNVLAYYSPQNDWVVSRKNQINGTYNGTLPHEVGHFFSLMHTFFGYEDNSFGPGSAGWPIAPVISPYHPNGQNIPTERQNGSNCSTAADMICDTPPDYNFGLIQSGCNAYNGGAKDPLGTLVDPSESNFMGYFSNCSTNYHFSPMQQAAILADLASPFRNYLDNNFSPIATNITTPIDLLTGPADADTTEYYNEVLLQWQSVTGANMYLLDIDINGFYSSPLRQSFILTGTSKLMTNLAKNKKYFWRVRPFNEYYTCAEARERTFRTSSATSSTADIAELDKWTVAPNPAAGNDQLRVFLNATSHFDAELRVLDATGRQVLQLENQSIPAGETVLSLPLSGLAEGLYFVVLQSGTGSAVRKLMVAR